MTMVVVFQLNLWLWVEVTTNSNYFDVPPMLSAIASSVAFLTCSSSAFKFCSFLLPLSSSFNVITFASFSSSLSPRLKGSLSATGLGSTVDNGCHLLVLAPLTGVVLVGAVAVVVEDGFGEAEYMSLISSGGPSWNDTLRLPLGERRPEPAVPGRNKLGFARGRLDVRGGASPSFSSSLEKSSPISCGSASYRCRSAERRPSALRRLG